MILCDTNILIHAFNGKKNTLDDLQKIGRENVVLSSITVMELLQGMGSKKELATMKTRMKYFDVIELDEKISVAAKTFIEKYSLSHGLTIPDAIIGATSAVYQIPLFTYNVKDFKFIPQIVLYKQ